MRRVIHARVVAEDRVLPDGCVEVEAGLITKVSPLTGPVRADDIDLRGDWLVPGFLDALWAQKSWGPWTTYGGGGYATNPAPGARDYLFGGWLVQRDLSKKLALGGEVFAQGPTMEGEHRTVFLNLGGYYNFTENFSLLFSAGHSVLGDRHALFYVGLYWTWGGPSKEQSAKYARWSWHSDSLEVAAVTCTSCQRH